MPTVKSVLKMAAQVVVVTYASIYISQLVGDLFDHVVGE